MPRHWPPSRNVVSNMKTLLDGMGLSGGANTPTVEDRIQKRSADRADDFKPGFLDFCDDILRVALIQAEKIDLLVTTGTMGGHTDADDIQVFPVNDVGHFFEILGVFIHHHVNP